MTVKAVIWDIGNVLIGWDPRRFYDARIGPDRRRALFAQVDLHGMNLRIDRGAPFRETVEALADAHPGWASEIRMWHDNWLEFTHPMPRSERLFEALRRRGVPVFALSNFGRGPFELARRRFPVLDRFDRVFLSGDLRAIKPEPEIYETLETGTGLPPDVLLFADDRPENIDTARARGWRTHLFDGPEGWAARLVAEGLLTEEDIA
ncbi:HAD family hydrolase [Jhaorihella thermophila]|uniref:2-haloacid dehalogenase n=1 Tax=Jhaorihella thermophila TaxID=488547 RepID=A0A1H5T791_9RHOB|nr:HAD family phosphatase [Jhaorihella thermophila]SEF58675.1 2-haloacid dehalogenase [Jhaorihella thermophila]